MDSIRDQEKVTWQEETFNIFLKLTNNIRADFHKPAFSFHYRSARYGQRIWRYNCSDLCVLLSINVQFFSSATFNTLSLIEINLTVLFSIAMSDLSCVRILSTAHKISEKLQMQSISSLFTENTNTTTITNQKKIPHTFNPVSSQMRHLQRMD